MINAGVAAERNIKSAAVDSVRRPSKQLGRFFLE